VTLIGVKSKYGSGWGTSPGLMNINDTPKKKVVLVYLVKTLQCNVENKVRNLRTIIS